MKPQEKLIVKGKDGAFVIFKLAYSSVEAYKNFLRKKNFIPTSVKTVKDFERIPFISKETYLHKYSFKSYFPAGKIPPMAYASSGSSGNPTFWFRGDEQEKSGGIIHERIFREVFKIAKKEKTLVVICFSMGVWVAGNYTLASCRYLSRVGYSLTSITPSIELGDFLHIIKNLAPKFDNVIVAGYAPFLVDAFRAAQKQNIQVRGKNLYIITAGSKLTESLRKNLAQATSIKDLTNILSVYGSADAGVIGYETKFSIYFRQWLLKNKSAAKELLGNFQEVPSFLKYDPEVTYIEEKNGELILTANMGTPLIRYNTHDTGTIFSPEKVSDFLHTFESSDVKGLIEEYKKDKSNLLVLKGRKDVLLTFYALNIYPEFIEKGIQSSGVSTSLSGSYFAYTKALKGKTSEKLFLTFELNKGERPTKNLKNKIFKAVLQSLVENSIEYRKLYSAMGYAVEPKVSLKIHNQEFNLPKSQKLLLYLLGKKPKLITSP